MTQYLPSNLLALFAPRDPIPYLPPPQKLPWEKTSGGYHGVAQFVKWFEDSKDTPPPTRVETRDERKERKRKERAEQVAYKLEQDLALWDPQNDPNMTGDPYKTLFVGRINYDTTESKLRRELEMYGPVKKVHLVHDVKTGKPRGYGYIEFEHERDMHSAYKHADGRKIDNKRVLVDVERGRTVKGWRPRRLGGGLGSTRKGGPEVNSKYSGRDDAAKDRSRSRSPRRRSRSRERRRRSRSRERRRRSKSREKERRRSKEKDATEARDESRRRRRSRSRHRSRSRDRKRSRRSRSRERRRSRDRIREPKKEPEDGVAVPEETGPVDNEDFSEVRVKQERERGYADEIQMVQESSAPQYQKERSNGVEEGYAEYGQEVNGGEDYTQGDGGYQGGEYGEVGEEQ